MNLMMNNIKNEIKGDDLNLIDISSYPMGLYMLYMKRNGDIMESKKIIIQ